MKRRMVGGDDPFYLKFLGQADPIGAKRRFSVDIRLYSL